MATCKGCGKEFGSKDSMDQHYASKHASPKPAPAPKKKSSKKMIFTVAAVVIVLLGYFAFFSGSGEKPVVTSADLSEINLDEVPGRAIHWHPHVSIVINGEQVRIPSNIGASSNVHSAGIAMAPMHTHDATGVLHMESARPSPETVILGYFFNEVWKRNFNSTCIFEYCNGTEGNLTMRVNGVPNYRFNNYIPKDNDRIEIRFE